MEDKDKELMEIDELTVDVKVEIKEEEIDHELQEENDLQMNLKVEVKDEVCDEAINDSTLEVYSGLYWPPNAKDLSHDSSGSVLLDPKLGS